MKKPNVVNLKLQTVYVESKAIKTDFNWKIGKPIFDCGNDEIAQALGYASRDEYRREMNSKKGYKKLIKLMGK
jgi:hypothetical protein